VCPQLAVMYLICNFLAISHILFQLSVTDGRKVACPHHLMEGRRLITTYSLLYFYPVISKKMVGSENHMVNADMAKSQFKFPQGRLREILFVKQNESIFHNAISYNALINYKVTIFLCFIFCSTSTQLGPRLLTVQVFISHTHARAR